MATKKAKKTAASKKSKTGTGRAVLTVDFEDTESRKGKKSSRKKHYKPGDYAVKVTKAKTGKSSQKKTPQIEVTFQFIDGKNKGDTIVDQFYLTDGSLWRLRALMEGMGLKVPSKKVKIDLKKFIGKKLAITIDDDVWEDDEGKERVKSNVVDTFLLTEMEAGDEDEVLDEDDDEDEDLDDDEDDDENEDEDSEDDDDDDDEDDDEIEDVDLDDI